MICSNCGMIIGVNDKKCGYCFQYGTGTVKQETTSTAPSQTIAVAGETPLETVTSPAETVEQEVESEVSPAEEYGLLGQKRVLVTSRGARLGLFNTKIYTEITYGSNGLMIQQRPARLQGASQIAYKDITNVTTKRTISVYWIILMALGVLIAIPSAGLGLILTIAAFFLGWDHTICIQQKNGSILNIASANGTTARLFYTELLKIKGM